MTEPQRVVDALRRIEAGLERIVSSASQSIAQTQAEVARVERQLEQRQRELDAERDEAQRELRDCENTVYYDQDGYAYHPDCSSYRQAVREAEEKLTQLRTLCDTFDQAKSRFEGQASMLRSAVTRDVPAACSWLRDQQAALVKFERAEALATIAPILASPSMGGYLNQLVGDIGETRGHAWLKRMGATRAGTGLHYGRQGIDVYGIRNTPRGRTLILMEVKTTADARKSGLAKSLLTIGKKDGLQQGSPLWNESRLRLASDKGNPIARHIMTSRVKTDNTRIMRTEHYVLFVNVASGQERLYRVIPNKARNRVEHLNEMRL